MSPPPYATMIKARDQLYRFNRRRELAGLLKKSGYAEKAQGVSEEALAIQQELNNMLFDIEAVLNGVQVNIGDIRRVLGNHEQRIHALGMAR